MKTKLSVILALFTFYFANAQQDQVDSEMNSAKGITFQHGDMFIEGSIQITTGGDRDYYAFNPKFGYFLNDKFAVGGQLSYSSNKVEATDEKLIFLESVVSQDIMYWNSIKNDSKLMEK